jgi:hypothetical protein
MGRPHVAQASGHVGHACFLLGPPLLHFLLSEVLFRGKTGSRKVSSNLDSIWVPEVKNIKEEVFWFSQVNPIKLGNM